MGTMPVMLQQGSQHEEINGKRGARKPQNMVNIPNQQIPQGVF